jgi:ribonuclease G
MKPAFCFAHRAIILAELWLDDAPGERRAALVRDGNILEIHIQRDRHFVVGEIGSARVDSRTKAGAYLTADDGRKMLVRRGSGLTEGSKAIYQVTREAIAEPGLVKLAEAQLLEALPSFVPTAESLWEERLNAASANVRRNADISDAFEPALAGSSQAGDAIISFQRTKAGLVFDIDGTGNPMELNIAAAREIARLLRLYQVGAMVMIDFIAVESKQDRQKIADAFRDASADDPRPFESTAVNGFGMMQVVRARPRPSVLDILFGTRIAALSDETQALSLLREASKSTGFGVRTITAPPPVAILLSTPEWQQQRQMCERMTGVPLVIVADAAMAGYGHVHVSQA